MNLHEYQAKQLFAEYGVPVAAGDVAHSAAEAVEQARKLGGDAWLVTAQVHAGGRDLGVMVARRTFYRNFNISAIRAAIRSTPLEDFYIVASEFDADGRAIFRVHINPLVWWMWAAGPLLALGTVFAISPRRQPAPADSRIPRTALPAGVRTRGVEVA